MNKSVAQNSPVENLPNSQAGGALCQLTVEPTGEVVPNRHRNMKKKGIMRPAWDFNTCSRFVYVMYLQLLDNRGRSYLPDSLQIVCPIKPISSITIIVNCAIACLMQSFFNALGCYAVRYSWLVS